VHLDDLSGNGETEPRATLGTRVRAVDLAELLEDVLALLGRDAGAVSLTLSAKWPLAAPAAMRTSPANLMALPTR